ncbi:uncharacterized protein LOC118746581 [Rhagoletis pomonella]|uniref:uncharacterized protein LOC118746581 n=1 Tax=Rhagoletis pomonella TaxID=28610 RepID=UPI00177C6F6F|nr:uncharacterized protein LOC118746581 [Rhagoletis pomonella]
MSLSPITARTSKRKNKGLLPVRYRDLDKKIPLSRSPSDQTPKEHSRSSSQSQMSSSAQQPLTSNAQSQTASLAHSQNALSQTQQIVQPSSAQPQPDVPVQPQQSKVKEPPIKSSSQNKPQINVDELSRQLNKRMEDMKNEFQRQMQVMQTLLVSNTQQLRVEMAQSRSNASSETSLISKPAQPPSSDMLPREPTALQSMPPQSQASLPLAPPIVQPSPTPLGPTPSTFSTSQLPLTAPQSAPSFMQGSLPTSQSESAPPYMAQTHAQPQRVLPHFKYESQNNMVRARKIFPLPIFSGSPEDWQTFIEAFESTTAEFDYSNLHNIMRLRDALQGRARETVVSLLGNSSNVTTIIEILREAFGRPEQLIKSQIEKVRSIPPLVDGHLESLVNFANKMTNMATFLQNVDGFHHLSNPTLISELVAKLPTARQMMWAEKCLQLERPPTIVDFSNWLCTLRRLANMVTDTLPHNPVVRRQQQIRNNDSPNNRRYACASVVQENCLNCKGNCKTLSNCQSFLQMTSEDRWKKLKALKLCFSWLKKGHRVQQCLSRKHCRTNECQRVHHQLLHADFADASSGRRESRVNPSPVSIVADPTTPQQTEHRNCLADCSSDKVLFQILPVKLYGRDNVISTYAFVDDGANVSMIDRDLALKLGIRGKAEILELQWLNEQRNTQKTVRVNITTSGKEIDSEKYELSNVFTSTNLSLPIESCHIGELTKSGKNSHLLGVQIPNYTNVKPEVILSLNRAFLTVPMETPLQPCEAGPIAAKVRMDDLRFN